MDLENENGLTQHTEIYPILTVGVKIKVKYEIVLGLCDD